MEAPPFVHPLLIALRACTVKEQHDFAALAGTKRNYLYQLAGSSRVPRATLAVAIAKASREMHVRTTGRVPKVTVEQLVEAVEKNTPAAA
jgi:hypothetical protein